MEFPALDSLKLQRATDFKGELHIPHVYYFTSYYMKEFIQRFGFKLLYLDQYSRIVCSFNIKNHKVPNYSFFYIKTRKDIFLGNFFYYIKCLKISQKIKRYIYSVLNRI